MVNQKSRVRLSRCPTVGFGATPQVRSLAADRSTSRGLGQCLDFFVEHINDIDSQRQFVSANSYRALHEQFF